jgi:hypothetical protein
MSIGADGAEYCVKYWSIAAGVSIKDGGMPTNPAKKLRSWSNPPGIPGSVLSWSPQI